MYLLYQLLHVTTNYISVPSEDVFVSILSFIVHAKETHKETKNFMCDVQSDLRLKLSALHKDMYERKHRTNARERGIRIKIMQQALSKRPSFDRC